MNAVTRTSDGDRPITGWERLRSWWRAYRWWVVGGTALLVLGLGFVGFRTYLGPRAGSGWDMLYLSLQLFALDSGNITGPAPPSLEVARFLAPVLAAYGLAALVAGVFRDELLGLRTRLRRDHSIVCGLEAGWSLTRMLWAKGKQVVVIEREADHPRIEACRTMHIPVFVGDARDEQLLRKAGIRRARRLFTVCGDDAVNVKIAEKARRLSGGRREIRLLPARGPLRVLGHIEDPYLCQLLTMQELERPGDEVHIGFFSLSSGGARALLRQYPPTASPRSGSPHLMVVGLGRLGRQLVIQAARNWAAQGQPDDHRLWITAVDDDAKRQLDDLRERHPFLDHTCELRSRALPAHPFRLLEHPSFDPGSCPPVSNVFVCLPNDADGLQVALALRHQLRHTSIPVVVRTFDADLAALQTRDETADGGGLFVFDQLERACRIDDLFAGPNEILARALHEIYVRQQLAAGDTPATNPSIVAWEDLPERLRDDNRALADHIPVKLQKARCELGPLTDPDAELFSFTDTEIERLAIMEHDRWRKGAPEGQRHNVPWDDLEEKTKEIDRNLVRRMPALLASVDLQINRSGKHSIL